MIALKLALLVGVLVAGALGGALPLRRRGDVAAGRFLGWGNAFAAGVFLGAGLIHLLPAAAARWNALGWEYPLAFLLAALAFVLLLLVEHVVLPEAAHAEVHAPSGEAFAHLDDRVRFAPYVVLVALSIHSLLEGLALGAQAEVTGALVLFAAIVAHKTTAGFALGVSLARSALPVRRAWALLALFAATTPAGVALGALSYEALAGRARVGFEATFAALAAGTFTYVATLDILRDEFHDAAGRGSKWLLVTAGTALMALLALWV